MHTCVHTRTLWGLHVDTWCECARFLSLEGVSVMCCGKPSKKEWNLAWKRPLQTLGQGAPRPKRTIQHGAFSPAAAWNQQLHQVSMSNWLFSCATPPVSPCALMWLAGVKCSPDCLPASSRRPLLKPRLFPSRLPTDGSHAFVWPIAPVLVCGGWILEHFSRCFQGFYTLWRVLCYAVVTTTDKLK